jgi:hypothetical protein
MRPAGHVVTNYHVINDANDIQVTFMGGSEYSAKVVGADTDKDIAVLQVRAVGFRVLRLGVRHPASQWLRRCWLIGGATASLLHAPHSASSPTAGCVLLFLCCSILNLQPPPAGQGQRAKPARHLYAEAAQSVQHERRAHGGTKGAALLLVAMI